MHLLMETAIGDSQQYDVFSPEKLESVKRQLSSVSTRIEAANRKLVLEMKVRDAAQSIDRLPSAAKDLSRTGSKGKNSISAGPTSEEVIESARKCEELAQEIERLEKDEYQFQKQLLEHTAGVLQLTHKGYLKKDPSPEELRNGHFGLDMEGEFGGLGQYALYSQVLENEIRGQSTVDLAEQHKVILGVEKKVEEHNARLRDMILELVPNKTLLPQPPRQLQDDPNEVAEVLVGQVNFMQKCLDAMDDLLGARGTQSAMRHEENSQFIRDIEQRVEDLNHQLRDTILDLKPRKETLPDPARELKDDPTNPRTILVEQIDFLEACIKSMHDLLEERRALGESEFTEQRFEGLNRKLYEIMIEHDPAKAARYQPPPRPGQDTLFDQFDYLDQGLNAVDRRVGQLLDAADNSEHKLEELNTKLFETMTQNDEPEKAEKYQPPPESGGHTTEDQLLYLEQGLKVVERRMVQLGDIAENSSTKLVNFSNRAEQYVSVVGGLWDILTEEDKRDADPNAPHVDNFSLQAFSAKVQEIHGSYADMMDQKAVLTRQIQQQRELNAAADDAKDAKMDSMREEIGILKSQLLNGAGAEDRIARERTEDQLRAQTALAVSTEAQLRDLESEVVRLQTELTMAKAELDAGQGSRAQRAAEAAGDPALQVRVQTLQKELSETIADYENMTKATIEYEKEREQLESTADSLRDRVEVLEAQLAEERIAGMGAKSPGAESVRSVHGHTSAAVLKTEFKKMMRETRTEHAKALRVSPPFTPNMVFFLSIILIYLRPSKMKEGDWKPSSGH